MRPSQWFLTQAERGNPDTLLDHRHPPGQAWSTGNLVRPLVHGAAYFAELFQRVEAMSAGDLLLFTDWRGDPDERLTGEPGSEVSEVLARAARRGVDVRGLVWRSHLDRFAFSATENRHLGERIEAAGGQCLLDMRVRVGGSHHQKFVVLRHPGRPDADIAFVGGIDLCHSRRDDDTHDGDPQPQRMAAVYSLRPAWHDVTAAVTGPAVADVETVFRERWSDPAPLSRNPLHRIADRLRGEQRAGTPLPPQLAPPPPAGAHLVQLLRTYPQRRSGYPFARDGERSVAHGYSKALRNARHLVYVEDQYFWSRDVVQTFVTALREQPGLHLIAVLPHFPDQDGRFSMPPNEVGRLEALAAVRAAGGDRVAVYGVENEGGRPVYVHAKVCIVDDTWATIGSDNFNRRSWTHDSELSLAALDRDGRYARDLRLRLAREHLGRCDDDGLVDPLSAFAAFRASAQALGEWHAGDRSGARPPGRLRDLTVAELPARTALWAGPVYRRVYDPDGRPRALRRAGRF